LNRRGVSATVVAQKFLNHRAIRLCGVAASGGGEFYFAVLWVCILLLVGAFAPLLIIRKVAPASWSKSGEDKNAPAAISLGAF
jgi:hypothetical protein